MWHPLSPTCLTQLCQQLVWMWALVPESLHCQVVRSVNKAHYFFLCYCQDVELSPSLSLSLCSGYSCIPSEQGRNMPGPAVLAITILMGQREAGLRRGERSPSLEPPSVLACLRERSSGIIQRRCSSGLSVHIRPRSPQSRGGQLRMELSVCLT